MNPREAAYLALLFSLKEEGFITQSLEKWQKGHNPSPRDFALAYEIAAGACRMSLALDDVAANLSDKKRLSLKLKEKALLRTALYQYCFMSRVPPYAIANETIEIAKKYCHATFVGFLNALLRKLPLNLPSLPISKDVHSLSVKYSYPEFFISALIKDYGLEAAEEILKVQNLPPITMIRLRKPTPHVGLKLLESNKSAILEDYTYLKEIAASSDYYIQNATPFSLVEKLAEKTTSPKMILDLCASPGGKLLAVHDLFPEAVLFANDVSEEKIQKLKQNINKYRMSVELTVGQGEGYTSSKTFDLIILDVPCSNSGVLNKRPEARWRLSQQPLEELKKTQKKLIANAVQLLSTEGYLWYLTCSILKNENEDVVAEVCQEYNLELVDSKTILPNAAGWDGGFGAVLKKKN